jgi:Domain of unknown function (DUF4335)
MNIQRKYSLPNCTLLLEGLSDSRNTSNFQDLRPELSILVNAECYVGGYPQPLVGGRDFFESLVRAVSGYAQEFLSSIPHLDVNGEDSDLVRLVKVGTNRHRLIVHPEIADANFRNNNTYNQSAVQMDLNTVQLFDLVEAVDQFFADSQTLPELTLGLQSVSKANGVGSQVLAKQAIPATVGVSSLAAAAIIFGLLPAPEFKPLEPKPQEQATNTTNNNNNNGAIANPSPQAGTNPTQTPSANPTPAATSNPAPGPVADIESLITQVPEISDASQLKALSRQIYNEINPAWANRSGLSEDSIFRVGVAADGSILGYKAVNPKANDNVDKTPLPNLLYNPATRGPIQNEPIAQYRIVFTRGGVLQVSPWLGYKKTPDVVGAKITEANSVTELTNKLTESIKQNSGGTTTTHEKDLLYRVAVNKDGVIADYEPLNQPAFDSFRETPLPKMFQAVYGNNVAAPKNKEALAHFQVEFKTNGELQITPWQGYR